MCESQVEPELLTAGPELLTVFCLVGPVKQVVGLELLAVWPELLTVWPEWQTVFGSLVGPVTLAIPVLQVLVVGKASGSQIGPVLLVIYE